MKQIIDPRKVANFTEVYLDFLERSGKILVHFVHYAAMTAGRHLQVQVPQYSDCEIVESVERLLSEKNVISQ